MLSIDGLGLGMTKADVAVLAGSPGMLSSVPGGWQADEQQLLNVAFGPLANGRYTLLIDQ